MSLCIFTYISVVSLSLSLSCPRFLYECVLTHSRLSHYRNIVKVTEYSSSREIGLWVARMLGGEIKGLEGGGVEMGGRSGYVQFAHFCWRSLSANCNSELLKRAASFSFFCCEFSRANSLSLSLSLTLFFHDLRLLSFQQNWKASLGCLYKDEFLCANRVWSTPCFSQLLPSIFEIGRESYLSSSHSPFSPHFTPTLIFIGPFHRPFPPFPLFLNAPTTTPSVI